MVRQYILEHADVQIIGLAETKFRKYDNFTLPGFSWFGHNRADINKKARVGSGGVGFLVRNDILCGYDISILDITIKQSIYLSKRVFVIYRQVILLEVFIVKIFLIFSLHRLQNTSLTLNRL